MRVLVVTPWFPSTAHPGSGLFNLRDARLLATEHDVRVLHLIRPDWYAPARTYQENNAAAIEGIKVERMPFSAADPRTWQRARHAIRAGLAESDLIHTMAFPALLPFIGMRVRQPWVHTEHWSQLVTPTSRPVSVALSLLKRRFRRPTEVVAVSGSLAKVIDRYRARPATVIGNEVMAPVNELPEGHDLKGRITLLGVGGIVARKGVLEAIDTLVQLVDRGVDVELHWAGEGPLRDAMLKRAELGGVKDRLVLRGQLSPRELSDELLNADIFLLPVETETFGVAIAEALSHGLPVVTSGTGGHEEFLPQRASRLVSSREGSALADAVQELITDPQLWSRKEIATYSGRLFSEKARANAYRGVYSQAVAEG